MLRPLSRRAAALSAALLSATALFAFYDDARASRPAPALENAETDSLHERHFHTHSGEVTLGALIEMQRARRATRAGTGRPLSQAPSPAGWQGQLGAFTTAEAAERERAEVMRTASPALPVVVHYDGALYRVRSAVAERELATDFCRGIGEAGWECFVRRTQD